MVQPSLDSTSLGFAHLHQDDGYDNDKVDNEDDHDDIRGDKPEQKPSYRDEGFRGFGSLDVFLPPVAVAPPVACAPPLQSLDLKCGIKSSGNRP